jgi:hypothetical protein
MLLTRFFKPSRGRLKAAIGHDMEFTLEIRNLLNAITLQIRNLLSAIYIRYLTDMDGFTVSVISQLLVICSFDIDFFLFFFFMAGLQMVACISEQILYMTSVLNSFVNRLIIGTGRRLDDLMYLEFLIRFRLMDDLLRPICPQCKINLMHLYCLVEKAYMLVPPVIPI